VDIKKLSSLINFKFVIFDECPKYSRSVFDFKLKLENNKNYEIFVSFFLKTLHLFASMEI
jgi:hypothetical protein